jgi:hypothetical protein
LQVAGVVLEPAFCWVQRVLLAAAAVVVALG